MPNGIRTSSLVPDHVCPQATQDVPPKDHRLWWTAIPTSFCITKHITHQQVAFYEIPDGVPSIDDQYQTHFLERGQYNVSNATHQPTTVALSNDTFYTPKPSEDRHIFNVITTPLPRVTTPNDESSSAETGESSGGSDKNYKSSIQRITLPNPRRARMAVLIDSHA